MLPERMDPTPAVDGLAGTLRLLAVVLIGALATFAILAALGVLPAAVLQDYAGKAALVGAIVAVAVAAMALVLRAGRR
jgi:hypothetical protein